jgi:hypothetical protein
MPLPVYQRLLGCLLSTRTASTLLLPSVFTYWVRSYWNVVYPYGHVPSEVPLIHTSLFMYTPSNSMRICLPAYDESSAKVFRYQPTPPAMNPDIPEALWLNPSARLKSWGTVTFVQEVSAKVGCWA